MARKYSGIGSDPSPDLVLITPSDINNLAFGVRGLMVTGAGNVRVTTEMGTDIIIPGLVAGVLYPFAVTKVWATSTTATGIMGVY